MFHARRLAPLLLALTLLAPVVSLAQQPAPEEEAPQARDPLQVTFQPNERRLGVEAEAVPLREVLDKVNKLTGVKFWVAPGINPPISRNVPDLPIERAIKHVLGPRANFVMIYADVTDAEGNTRAVLDEVRVLEGGVIDPGDGSAADAAPPPNAPTGLPQMAPEELAARQAEKQAKMAEKAAARAERAAAKNNRGGRSGGRGGQTAAPDPTAGQAPTDQGGASQQPPSSQVGGAPSGQAPPAAPPTGTGTTSGGRRRR